MPDHVGGEPAPHDAALAAERDAVAYEGVRRAVADLAAAQRSYNRAVATGDGSQVRVARRLARNSWIDAFDELIGRQVALLAEIDAHRRRVTAVGELEPTKDSELTRRRSLLLDYLAAVREGRRLAEAYRTDNTSE